MSQVKEGLMEVYVEGFSYPFALRLEFEVVMYKSDRTFYASLPRKGGPKNDLWALRDDLLC